MGSEFEDVKYTYQKFGFIGWEKRPPHLLDGVVMAERLAFLDEELRELKAAAAAGDLAEVADALADLVVVAYGTGVLMHLPWEDVWAEVCRANNAKVRGAGRHHGHRPGADLVKPPGWNAPDLRSILARHGYVDEECAVDGVVRVTQGI